jgi:hypothetical protein
MTRESHSTIQNQAAAGQLVEQALQCLEEADTFTAIEFLNQQPKPLVVAAAYNDLVKDLYWQKRNMATMAALCRAGIQFCLDQAEETALTDRNKTADLRSAAKQLAFNLASFTWPGWDEPEIELDPSQTADGLDAARLNLRLALELDKGDLALSRAYWMLAGHLLAAHAATGAEATYRRAALYAGRAGDDAEKLLALAFAALVRWMMEPESDGRRQVFATAREKLTTLAEGPAYLAQIDGARRVFFSFQ